MSQTALGESLGLTFQQVQKYERGANRISASRLWKMADVLSVPVSFFFDDLPERLPEGNVAPVDVSLSDDNVMARRETLELVRAYYRIADPSIRKQLFDLTKATSAALSGDAKGSKDEAA
jgi:Predicted transcriptional regulators